LKRLISSREKYMLNSSLKTMDDLDAYAENTVSPVYYLFLEAMGLYIIVYIFFFIYLFTKNIIIL